MAGVLMDMAISLDGFVSGPGGADAGLYDWYFEPSPASAPIVEELVRTTGAIVIGRGAFGTGEDEGWDDTPYHVKHFVVTHRPPERPVSGSVDFTFVTDGIVRAVELARAAAGDRWVTVGGGADTARQLLALGLVDELQLHLVPVLIGDGLRLFLPGEPGHTGTIVRVVDAPNVTHLRYRLH
jgi:dihydrofolate reductase